MKGLYSSLDAVLTLHLGRYLLRSQLSRRLETKVKSLHKLVDR